MSGNSTVNFYTRSFALQKVQLFKDSPPIKRRISDDVRFAATELADVVKQTALELEDIRKSLSRNTSSSKYVECFGCFLKVFATLLPHKFLIHLLIRSEE